MGMSALVLTTGCGPDRSDGTGVQAHSAAAKVEPLGVAAYTQSPAPDISYGCQARSTRYPWGKSDFRIWTPKVTTVPDHPDQTPGAPNRPAFSARVIQAYGEDYGEARRSVILETEDGYRRQFPTVYFSDADNAIVQSAIADHPAPPDPAVYQRTYYAPDPDAPLTTPDLLASGQLHVVETQHFAIWYGNGRDDSYDFARAIGWERRDFDVAIRETGEWLEKAWVISRDVIGAPMPFADSQNKEKLNIFICGTGRPNVSGGDHDGCGAGAARVMGISGWALHKGSNVLAHEFSHMIQYRAGNFRENPGSGPFWETGANFNAYAISPSFTSAPVYLNQLEYGPTFSPPRYEQHPFMTYVYENDRTRPLVWSIWKLATQNGWSARPRDYVDQLVQSGIRTGAYPQGFKSFDDDMGWYGARLVTMDFFNQRNLLDGGRPSPTTSSVGHFHTPLVPSAGNACVYTPPAERNLLQWGTHIVPLTPSGQRVTVTLNGATTDNQAAWRFAIVAVKPGDVPVYSALARTEGKGSGTVSLTVPAGAQAYLVVTATPYQYETLGWQPDHKPARGTPFPYSVRIEGALPWTAAVQSCDRDTAPGIWAINWNLNGNGANWRRC
jgi:hypothetical protein